jgi:hypothetical protein
MINFKNEEVKFEKNVKKTEESAHVHFETTRISGEEIRLLLLIEYNH